VTVTITRPEAIPRIPALDGIRALAVLAVIAYHCQLFAPTVQSSVAGQLYRELAAHGSYGVDLFFTLSGFLITGILCETRHAASYFWTFYARRALRIFPPYYVFLAASVALVHLPWSTQAWLRTYLTNVLVARDSFGALPHALRHLWSLAVEEQFYLVWPLVVFLVRPRALLATCMLTIVASLAVRSWMMLVGFHEVAAYVLTPTRADELAWGAALAVALRLPQNTLARLARYGWPVSAGLALLFVGLWSARYAQVIAGGAPVYDLCEWTLADLICAAMLAGAVTGSPDAPIQRLLGWSGLRAIGRWSYVMYLVQQPIAVALGRSRVAPRAIGSVVGSPLVALLLFTGLVVALSAGVACVSGRTLEKWFSRLKDRAPYRLTYQ
jgi:peptidoglycan/LPS O-acetylase OafA/YrhL